VWLIRRHHLDIYVVGGNSMILPHCGSCWTPLADKLYRRERHDYTGACKACGRKTTSAHGWHGSRAVWTCSQKCTAAVRRDRQDRPMATCARCGEQFEPARKDAVYCRARCRQAAYRDRQRDGSQPVGQGERLLAVTGTGAA
jgi:hypothetical protein